MNEKLLMIVIATMTVSPFLLFVGPFPFGMIVNAIFWSAVLVSNIKGRFNDDFSTNMPHGTVNELLPSGRNRVVVDTEVRQTAMRFLEETIGEKSMETIKRGRPLKYMSKNYIFTLKLDGQVTIKSPSTLFNARERIGSVYSDNLPIEDCLASFYVWSMNNPVNLDEKWGCGRIKFFDKTK